MWIYSYFLSRELWRLPKPHGFIRLLKFIVKIKREQHSLLLVKGSTKSTNIEGHVEKVGYPLRTQRLKKN